MDNSEVQNIPEPQDEIDKLRANAVAASQLEDAPTMGKTGGSGKEIKVRLSPWVMRGIIATLLLVLAAEAVLFTQIRKESQQIIVANAPPVSASEMPEVSAPLSAPPVEAADENTSFEPEPTVVPLPPELEGVEYPVLEE